MSSSFKNTLFLDINLQNNITHDTCSKERDIYIFFRNVLKLDDYEKNSATIKHLQTLFFHSIFFSNSRMYILVKNVYNPNFMSDFFTPAKFFYSLLKLDKCYGTQRIETYS